MILTWDSPGTSQKRSFPSTARNNIIMQVGKDLYRSLFHLLTQRQASFKVRASFSGPHPTEFWKISIDGDSATSLHIVFPPPPYGSSEQHPFPERMYIPGNAEFFSHKERVRWRTWGLASWASDTLFLSTRCVLGCRRSPWWTVKSW